jgi:hypothetical protein
VYVPCILAPCSLQQPHKYKTNLLVQCAAVISAGSRVTRLCSDLLRLVHAPAAEYSPDMHSMHGSSR